MEISESQFNNSLGGVLRRIIENFNIKLTQYLSSCEDIKDVKDIMNIVDDNNKGNVSDFKIENFIIKLT